MTSLPRTSQAPAETRPVSRRAAHRDRSFLRGETTRSVCTLRAVLECWVAESTTQGQRTLIASKILPAIQLMINFLVTHRMSWDVPSPDSSRQNYFLGHKNASHLRAETSHAVCALRGSLQSWLRDSSTTERQRALLTDLLPALERIIASLVRGRMCWDEVSPEGCDAEEV